MTDGFEGALAARLLEERTRALAIPRLARAAGPTARILALTLGEALYGLPVESVLRVLSADPSTPAPDSAPALLGVASLEGRIFNLLDLARLLGSALPEAQAEGHLILLRGDSPRFALLCSRALDIFDAEVLPAVDSQQDRAASAVTGHARAPSGHALREGTIALLDPARLLAGFATIRREIAT